MNKKLYFSLIGPAVILFIILLIALPETKKFYSLLAPVVFWIVYYIVGSFNKKKNADERI